MAKHITTETVPDIIFKAQRVLRTIVQVGIPAFLGFALVLPMIIDAAGLPVDSSVRLWLLAAAAIVTAVAGAITRIMAIPAVNVWLTKIGLGAIPKKEITEAPIDAAGVVDISSLPVSSGSLTVASYSPSYNAPSQTSSAVLTDSEIEADKQAQIARDELGK